MNRGNVFREKGDLQRALQDYSEAIRLKPDLADAFNNRANARNAKGDAAGALHDLNEAIRLKPDYAQAFVNRAYTRNTMGDAQGACRTSTNQSDYEIKSILSRFGKSEILRG